MPPPPPNFGSGFHEGFAVALTTRDLQENKDLRNDPILPPVEALNDRDNPSYRFASRLHLTVEIYESSTRNLFWRKDLPNIFDAVQLTEERVVESLRRAVENFPHRIEKDPNLPDIE